MLYLNGIEVARFNMGYAARAWTDASHVFPAARLVAVDVSSSLLHKGANLLAAELHRHPFSDSFLEFSVAAVLVAADSRRQLRQFPAVRASADVALPRGLNGRCTTRRWS